MMTNSNLKSFVPDMERVAVLHWEMQNRLSDRPIDWEKVAAARDIYLKEKNALGEAMATGGLIGAFQVFEKDLCIPSYTHTMRDIRS